MIQFTTEITAFQLPDDAVVAKGAFLEKFTDPSETWLRAYALDMPEVITDIITAHTNGVLIHCLLDHSQAVGHFEKPLVEQLVAAGVEVTVATSYAGSAYIAHEKGFVTTRSDCWEGSTNFSTSAWLQINTALQFNSAAWAAEFLDSFKRNVIYAWAKEPEMQLMQKAPAWVP